MKNDNGTIKAIKKQHISAAVAFAIENVPGVDEKTLEKFLELVNVTGNFGSISEDELLEKSRLFRKYIPSSCHHSLLVLAELLEINVSTLAADTRPSKQLPHKKRTTFFVRPHFAKAPTSIQ